MPFRRSRRSGKARLGRGIGTDSRNGMNGFHSRVRQPAIHTNGGIWCERTSCLPGIEPGCRLNLLAAGAPTRERDRRKTWRFLRRWQLSPRFVWDWLESNWVCEGYQVSASHPLPRKLRQAGIENAKFLVKACVYVSSTTHSMITAGLFPDSYAFVDVCFWCRELRRFARNALGWMASLGSWPKMLERQGIKGTFFPTSSCDVPRPCRTA